MFFMNSSIYSIYVAWFPTLLAERGVAGQQAGLMVSTLTLANMAAVFSIPIMSDRLGLRRPFIWGFSGISALTVTLLILAPTGFAWGILPILGASAAGPFTMGFVLPTELVDYKSLGSASGIVLSVGWLGIGYGTWLAGFLRDLSGSFYTTLLVLVISSLIIMAIGFVLPETGRRGTIAGDQFQH
jgi:CP family cyanate transporter-like MFS transporter